MTYDEYKSVAMRFVVAKFAVADAIRRWAEAVAADAELLRVEAEEREPWAVVQTAQVWADREWIKQQPRQAYDEIDAALGAERRALNALCVAKLAYYQMCAKEASWPEST